MRQQPQIILFNYFKKSSNAQQFSRNFQKKLKGFPTSNIQKEVPGTLLQIITILMSKTMYDTFPKEYVDPSYWNPQNENFEIIDWEKWYQTNPKVPTVFDPPQRHRSFQSFASLGMWWWGRSCYFKPCASVLQCCCPAKPETGRISEGDTILNKILNPKTTSEDAPKEFKNHLYWTENNVAPETLINFGSWAWRKQNSGVIGLGMINFDWSADDTCFGYIFGFLTKTRAAAVQRSPDGKWFALSTIADPTQGKVNWLFIYVVQQGDKFETVDGQPMDYVKPGDIVRVTWDGDDPYANDNSQLSYFYFPRRVASIDSNGNLVKNSSHYDKLLKVATNDASSYCCETCCYCWHCGSAEDLFDFQVNHIADKQTFRKSSAPPTAEVIERHLNKD